MDNIGYIWIMCLGILRDSFDKLELESHQNNHFERIKTSFGKTFFQWSPLWSYGPPLNFFSVSFENF